MHITQYLYLVSCSWCLFISAQINSQSLAQRVQVSSAWPTPAPTPTARSSSSRRPEGLDLEIAQSVRKRWLTIATIIRITLVSI